MASRKENFRRKVRAQRATRKREAREDALEADRQELCDKARAAGLPLPEFLLGKALGCL